MKGEQGERYRKSQSSQRLRLRPQSRCVLGSRKHTHDVDLVDFGSKGSTSAVESMRAAMAPKAIAWWFIDLANEADFADQTSAVLRDATARDVACHPVALTGRMQLAVGTYRHSINRPESDWSPTMTHRLLSMRDVLARLCMSKSRLYRSINCGEFPRPVPIGRHRVAFVEAEVENWITERMKARDQGEGVDARHLRAVKAYAARR